MIEWRVTDDGLAPHVDGRRVVWAPQPGSQMAFLHCPIDECLLHGDRGGGKTELLIMAFCQHVGKGWGEAWTGIIFRRTYKELLDIMSRSEAFIRKVWPQATYNGTDKVWKWPEGERLYFAYYMRDADYWGYHGRQFPFIGWEELCSWHNLDGYKQMFSCNRSKHPAVPKLVRATTNPYGVGHNLVKARFRLPHRGMVGPVIRDSLDVDGIPEPPRVAIQSRLEENKVLLYADPHYKQRVLAAAKNAAQRAAWESGDWDIVAGGMFDDIWNARRHMLPDFPFSKIPPRWRITRSYDHGQSKPFSVGWWVVSNGEPFIYNGVTYGPVRGDKIRIAEWYGWRVGQPNVGLELSARKIAIGIRDRERDWGIKAVPGPADSSIFDPDPSGNASVAGDMEAVGVRWEHADKGPGSRKQGWQQIRKYLEAAAEYPRERPGLFALDRCQQYKRCLPTMSRDDKDLDDVDTDSEDHIGDEVRYFLRHEPAQVVVRSWR